jgi:hypothetical protein
MKNMDTVDLKAELSEMMMMLLICHLSTDVEEVHGVEEVEVEEVVRRVLVPRDQANNVACSRESSNGESSELEELLRWFLERLRGQQYRRSIPLQIFNTYNFNKYFV